MQAHSFRLLFSTVCGAVLLSPGLAAQSESLRPERSRSVPIDIICGPQASLTPPVPAIRVIGGIEARKALFATGELVVIDAGTAKGIQPGQAFYARRVIKDRFAEKTTEAAPHSVHTGGWVTIVEAGTDKSTARISESCDGVVEGDYLEPFVLPALAASAPGEPDFAHPGRVLLGDDRRQMAGSGGLMVIDRGSDHGIKPGQRLTIFRRATGDDGPIVRIGEAFVTTVQNETSLVRIDQSREVIQVGDLIALHR